MSEEKLDINVSKRYRRYYTYIEPIITDPLIRGYFTLVASCFLIAFFIFFALSPTFSTILGLVRKIEDQKKVLSQMNTKINSLINAQENFSAADPYLSYLDYALPEKSTPETILTGVIKVATASGITLNTLQIGSAVISDETATSAGGAKPARKEATTAAGTSFYTAQSLNLPLITVTTGAGGKEDKLRDFAGKLLGLPRLISVNMLSLNSSAKGDNPLVVDLNGQAFYLPEDN